ncbi:ABC transporter permease [Actinomyces qiguomingii]|uniref:ABC transporter permease n=1 Tax=Actinomyces qiguomingii TaxID=2057800 RepID=UPI001E3E6D6B|nr:ABC transporter permease [Actinomyces qiguomingii]
MTAAVIAEPAAPVPASGHRPLRTAVLVAKVTVHELSRRRGALILALLLPLTFYLARVDTHWTALRLLSIGLGWAAATLTLFTSVSSRSIDLRLAASGASPTALVLGRHAAVLGLGWIIAALYSALVLLTIGHRLTHPAAVPLMLLLTVTVAAPLGSVAAALVPRDLEGALLLLAVMALQLLVDPAAAWTRVLPLWSTRELSSYIVEALGAQAGDYLWRGLLHGVGFAVGLVVLTWLLGVWRLRVIRLPDPQ